MSFLSPAAFALLGLIIPVVALYILKLRRRREPISTLMFWEKVFKEKQTTSLLQKLRHLLSLILQLLFLSLIVLALARPQLAFTTRSARQIIMAIDRSASMNTIYDQVSRLESAKRKALHKIDGLRFMDEMMVVSFNTQPVIHSPFTKHQKSLRQAVESLQPTDVRTNLKPTLDLAYEIAQTRPNPEIVILSDFHHISDSLADRLRHPPEEVELSLIRVGAETDDNVGITQFRVRKSFVNAFDYQTLLTVKNTSQVEKRFNVELYFDDALFDVRPYVLPPGESKSEIFGNFTFEGGKLKAVLDIEDALSSDNTAYAALPEREKIPVLLVTSGNPFFENALAVDESIDVKVISPEDYAPDVKDYQVVIFDRYNPTGLGDGNYIFVYPPKEGAIWEIGDPLEFPIITDWSREHPILKFANLTNVQVGEAYQVKPPDTAQVLVRSFEDPLIIIDEASNLNKLAACSTRKIVFIALDVLKSDLPLRIAFPLIVANTIQWFNSYSRSQENHLYTGEILRKQVDASREEGRGDGGTRGRGSGKGSVGNVIITGPRTRRWEIPVNSGELLFNQTQTAGFYELEIGDNQETWALNLTDENESKIGAAEVIKDLLKEDLTLKSSLILRHPLWIYLVSLAAGLSFIEWFLYQRRRID